jgi:hypothetical protein
VRPYLEKTHHQKRVDRVAQGVDSEFKPQYHKKRKKERKKFSFKLLSIKEHLKILYLKVTLI